jgi:hypothetical protein
MAKVNVKMARAQDRHEWLSFEDPDEDRTWTFDLTFLLSKWTCIFGSGCKGVLTEDAPELVQGCCSYGAHFTDDDDRTRVVLAAETLTADQWQFRAQGLRKGVVKQQKDGSWITRQADDACIFLNRPGFPGGPGCALHRAAIDQGRHFKDLKPDVCWQLPLRRVDTSDDGGHVTSTIREWKRRDWGDGGLEFSWWCTEAPDAFVGEHTVLHSARDELVELTRPEVYDMLLDAVAERLAVGPVLPHPAVRVTINGSRKAKAKASAAS